MRNSILYIYSFFNCTSNNRAVDGDDEDEDEDMIAIGGGDSEEDEEVVEKVDDGIPKKADVDYDDESRFVV